MPSFAPIAVYLDANVLFSACYDARSSFLTVWRLADVTPVTSVYAVAEVARHIVLPAQRLRFDRMLAATRLVSDANPAFVPENVQLAAKDRPILAAAVAAGVDYLVTGDRHHFSHLYLRKVSHLRILTPAEFLVLHGDRLLP